MRRFVTTLFAVLLAATVPAAAWAETDIVLDNETSNTDVDTGDSSFTNTDNSSVSSGTQFEESNDPALATTGAAVQGQASAVAPATTQSVPITTTDTSSVPRSSADLVLADADQTVTDSFDALFVGLPISDGSVSS